MRMASSPSPLAQAWLWQQEQEPNNGNSKHRGVFVEAGQEPEAITNQEGADGWPKLAIGWLGLGLNSPESENKRHANERPSLDLKRASKQIESWNWRENPHGHIKSPSR